MPKFQRMHLLAATVLLSTTAAAAVAEPATPDLAPQPAKPIATQDERAPQNATTPAGSTERLHIGLSDSSTKLVLPWFITELTDAVNERKSLGDTAKGLAQGL